MSRTLFATLVLAGAALGASSSTTTIVLGGDNQPLGASVVTADKTATVFDIKCLNTETCGYPAGVTVTQGPSTWAMTLVSPGSPVATISASCVLDTPHDSALCTTIVPPPLESPGKTVLTNTNLKESMNVITITAGLDKIAAAGSGSAAATTTAAAAGSQSSAASAAAGSSSGSAAASSKNAAPMATKPAVMAGVAAVVGALAL